MLFIDFDSPRGSRVLATPSNAADIPPNNALAGWAERRKTMAGGCSFVLEP